MKREIHWIGGLGCLVLLTAACVPGYNSLLFATKTNVGLVVDTKPPEINLDIGRRELLLAPTFEEGKTPPVLASFRFDSEKAFNNYIGSAFTTGDAAVAMARLYDAPDWPEAQGKEAWKRTAKEWKDKEDVYDSSVRLEMAPVYPSWVPKNEPGRVRPVLFGTDTSLGFKVSWAGMESPYPDYVRLAYERRELAFAAVTIGPDFEGEGENRKVTGLRARVPSLLATVDAKLEVGDKFLNSKIEYLQYFASGRAATALAMRKAVREAMLRRLDPESAPNGLGKAASGPKAVYSRIAVRGLLGVLNGITDDERFSDAKRARAAELIMGLNRLEQEIVPAALPVQFLTESFDTNGCFYRPSQSLGGDGFNRVLSYWRKLDESTEALIRLEKFAESGQPSVFLEDAGCDPGRDDDSPTVTGGVNGEAIAVLCPSSSTDTLAQCVQKLKLAMDRELITIRAKLGDSKVFDEANKFAYNAIFGE